MNKIEFAVLTRAALGKEYLGSDFNLFLFIRHGAWQLGKLKERREEYRVDAECLSHLSPFPSHLFSPSPLQALLPRASSVNTATYISVPVSVCVCLNTHPRDPLRTCTAMHSQAAFLSQMGSSSMYLLAFHLNA